MAEVEYTCTDGPEVIASWTRIAKRLKLYRKKAWAQWLFERTAKGCDCIIRMSIAIDKGTIVGWALLSDGVRHEKQLVLMAYVKKSYRSQGIGRRLYELAIGNRRGVLIPDVFRKRRKLDAKSYLTH